MKDQDKGGHIFNMDGAGADGNPTPRYAAYGATKRCLSHLGSSIKAELVQVCGRLRFDVQGLRVTGFLVRVCLQPIFRRMESPESDDIG